MRTRMAVAVALLVVVSAACGRAENIAPSAPDFADAADLVKQLREAWDDAGTVSWRVRGDNLHEWGWAETGQGRQQRIWGTGSPVRDTGGETTSPTGPRALRSNDIACQSTPVTGSTGKQWWACTYDQRLLDIVVPLGFDRQNPSRWIPALQEPGGLEEIGEAVVQVSASLTDAEVGEVTTRHFRFKAVTDADLPASPVEVWLDEQDRPVQMLIKDRQPMLPPADATATFFDYGGQVDLTPPPRTVMKDWLLVQQASTGPGVRACMMGHCPPLTEIGPPVRQR